MALADEAATPAELDHLSACAACAREVAAFRSLRAAGLRSGGGALAPASSSYRTAIRTTTPDSTWAVMTACGESTTAPESSTPRLTGPGCIST